jgi:hypothetical protein
MSKQKLVNLHKHNLQALLFALRLMIITQYWWLSTTDRPVFKSEHSPVRT